MAFSWPFSFFEDLALSDTAYDHIWTWQPCSEITHGQEISIFCPVNAGDAFRSGNCKFVSLYGSVTAQVPEDGHAIRGSCHQEITLANAMKTYSSKFSKFTYLVKEIKITDIGAWLRCLPVGLWLVNIKQVTLAIRWGYPVTSP